MFGYIAFVTEATVDGNIINNLSSGMLTTVARLGSVLVEHLNMFIVITLVIIAAVLRMMK